MVQRFMLGTLLAALLVTSAASAQANPSSEVRLLGNGTHLQLMQSGPSRTQVFGTGPNADVRIKNAGADIVVHFGSCPPGMVQTRITATGPNAPRVHVPRCVPKN